ncbi:disease resistance (CC-NBS-LRR class) family protein, partial [Trifolium pratense]
MHDVVREVAKSIASRLRLTLTYGVQRFTEMKKWPKIDQIQKLDAIVVPSSYIHELPERLDCPELKILILQTIGDISIVAELKSLEILILEKSDITDLPEEIGQLAHLRMLNLTNCSRLRLIPANLI